jgi:predicted Zn-dependent protease
MSACKFATVAVVVMAGALSYLAPATGRAQEATSAAATRATAMPSFDQLDTSHRGYLSRSDIPKDVEGLKALRMHFADADANNNGRLEKDEYQAYVARAAQPGQSSGGSAEPAAQPMH